MLPVRCKAGLEEPRYLTFRDERADSLALSDCGAGTRCRIPSYSIVRKQRVTPTDEGLSFFREVQHSFAALDRLGQAARDIKEFGNGRLRVASLMALSFDFAP